MDKIQLPSGNIDLPLVIAAEEEMKLHPQVDLRVEHHFSFGVYARTLYIPKGIALVGHFHKYENLNLLLQGEMSVSIDGQMKTIKAPYTVVSPPGTKRIAWAIEDSIWMTVIGTDKTNVEEIESEFIAKSEQEYLEFIQANQLELGLDKA